MQSPSPSLPAPEDDPDTHSMHVPSDIAPVAAEYFPPSHCVQASDPLTVLKVPATHASHASPSSPVYPLLHVQLSARPLPSPEYVCIGQALHVASDVAAVAVEYLPRPHSEHAPDPFTPLY
jgi:hypothetical protein